MMNPARVAPRAGRTVLATWFQVVSAREDTAKTRWMFVSRNKRCFIVIVVLFYLFNVSLFQFHVQTLALGHKRNYTKRMK